MTCIEGFRCRSPLNSWKAVSRVRTADDDAVIAPWNLEATSTESRLSTDPRQRSKIFWTAPEADTAMIRIPPVAIDDQ